MRVTSLETENSNVAVAHQPDATGERPRTRSMVSPRQVSTPPLRATTTNKREHINGTANHTGDHATSSVNPDALSKALKEVEDAGRPRETTPTGSPSRKRQRVWGDRFVGSLSLLCTCAGYYISQGYHWFSIVISLQSVEMCLGYNDLTAR